MESIQDKLMQQFQKMDKTYEEYAKSKGMTYLSLVILEGIYELGDGCTQKQLSECTFYPKQSINLIVKSFMEDGFIELKELPENRKNKGITLTEKGRKICEDIILPLVQEENGVMSDMGEKESRELIRLLELYGSAYCERIRNMIK